MKRNLLGSIIISCLCIVFFLLSQNQLASPWIKLALDEEMNEILVSSIQQSRALATLDPSNEAAYKDHFEKSQALLAHLEVMQANRKKVNMRYNLSLLLVFASLLAVLFFYHLFERRIMERRLSRLGENLQKLAVGDADLSPPTQDKDLIGRIDLMIHKTAGAMSHHRQRLKYLENLESWQESSRRIAHEIRTPLTTIRLEVKKLIKSVYKRLEDEPAFLQEGERSIQEELDQLSRFTDQYTSFAKIGKPKLKDANLRAYLQEFTELYAQAWPGVRLELAPSEEKQVALDRRLIRQVLVNLCNNSAKALEGHEGIVRFSIAEELETITLTVQDTGPGVDPAMKGRLFDPYITSGPGEGLGLGLAISKKIMLDHGGDLELQDSTGASFMLSFKKGESTP